LRTTIFFATVFILAGCNRNIPRVYFDSNNSLLYLDSSKNPDYVINSASIYSKAGVESEFYDMDSSLNLSQYSFKRYIDSVNDHRFSVTVYLKRNTGSYIMYYGEVENDSSVVELTQTDL